MERFDILHILNAVLFKNRAYAIFDMKNMKIQIRRNLNYERIKGSY